MYIMKSRLIFFRRLHFYFHYSKFMPWWFEALKALPEKIKKPWLLSLPWWLLRWAVDFINDYLLSSLWTIHFMLCVYYFCVMCKRHELPTLCYLLEEQLSYPWLIVVGTSRLFCVLSCCYLHLILFILLF